MILLKRNWKHISLPIASAQHPTMAGMILGVRFHCVTSGVRPEFCFARACMFYHNMCGSFVLILGCRSCITKRGCLRSYRNSFSHALVLEPVFPSGERVPKRKSCCVGHMRGTQGILWALFVLGGMLLCCEEEW